MGNDVSYTMYVGLAYVRTDDLMAHVCNGIPEMCSALHLSGYTMSVEC